MRYYILDKDLFKETDNKEYFHFNKRVSTIPIEATEINKNHYYEIYNSYYKDKKEKWEFQGESYRNLLNFLNLEEFHKLPIHNDLLFSYRKVYHNGQIFAAYYRNDRLNLFDLKGRFIKRTSYKNCSPIFNITKKKVC